MLSSLFPMALFDPPMYCSGRAKIIADAHLGDGSDSDDHTGGVATRLYEVLIDAVDNRDCVILLGDFLELWQTQFKLINIKYAHIFSVLRDLAIRDLLYIVKGNHDFCDDGDIEKYLESIGIHATYSMSLLACTDDRNVLMYHGHQHDKYMGRGAMLVTKLAAFLEKYIHRDVDVQLVRLYNAIMQSDDKYIDGAAENGFEYQSDSVLMGHVHKLHAETRNGIDVTLCGCWVNGKTDVVEMTKQGVFFDWP